MTLEFWAGKGSDPALATEALLVNEQYEHGIPPYKVRLRAHLPAYPDSSSPGSVAAGELVEYLNGLATGDVTLIGWSHTVDGAGSIGRSSSTSIVRYEGTLVEPPKVSDGPGPREISVFLTARRTDRTIRFTRGAAEG